MGELPNEAREPHREGAVEMREGLGSLPSPQEHEESLVRFVYANLAVEDPSITLREVREACAARPPSGRQPGPHRRPIEIRNLAEVREKISVCAEQERPPAEELVLRLHRTLMKGVPEVLGDPLKPGEFRGPADEHRFAGFKYLKNHRSVPWRIRSVIKSKQETNNERC